MERLSRDINDQVNVGLWSPVKLSPRGPPISHLLFADDIILCSKIKDHTCSNIVQTISVFGRALGQRINFAKTRLFFSANTPSITKYQACSSLGIAEGTKLGKYLGFPIFTSRPVKEDYQFLLDNFKRRLAGWKAKFLTLQAVSLLLSPCLMLCLIT